MPTAAAPRAPRALVINLDEVSSDSGFAAQVDRLAGLVERLEVKLAALVELDRTELTVSEFAAQTGWAKFTIREWLKEGKIAGEYDKRRREKWSIPVDQLKRVPKKPSGTTR